MCTVYSIVILGYHLIFAKAENLLFDLNCLAHIQTRCTYMSTVCVNHWFITGNHNEYKSLDELSIIISTISMLVDSALVHFGQHQIKNWQEFKNYAGFQACKLNCISIIPWKW